MTNNIKKLIDAGRWKPIAEAPKDGTEILVAARLKWNKSALDRKESRIGTGEIIGAFWWDAKSSVWKNRIGQFISTINAKRCMPIPDDRLADVCEVLLGGMDKIHEWCQENIETKSIVAGLALEIRDKIDRTLDKAEAIAGGETD